MKKICVVDTTFSRVDMGRLAVEEFDLFAKSKGWQASVTRRTVPGFKDLAVECVRLHDELKFDVALAIGWVGGMQIDTQCAHEASTAIANAQLLLRTHILEVFIHENEAQLEIDLIGIAEGRAIEHARNALYLVFEQEQLCAWAGTGRRQGGKSVGSLND